MLFGCDASVIAALTLSFTFCLVPLLCRDKHSEAEIVSIYPPTCNMLFSAAGSSGALGKQKKKLWLWSCSQPKVAAEPREEVESLGRYEERGLTGCVLFQTRCFQTNCGLIVLLVPVMTSLQLPVI